MEANVLLFETIKHLDNYGSTVFNVKVSLKYYINIIIYYIKKNQ